MPMARATIAGYGTSKALGGTFILTRAFRVERVTGIEPALSAWESHKIGLEWAATPARRALTWPGLAPADTSLWPVDGPAVPSQIALSAVVALTRRVEGKDR